MLNELLPMGNPLLTTDRALIYEHFDTIPMLHPGIVIISNAETILRTLTIKQVQIILRKFKSGFRQWHEVSCGNSIIQITQDSISIFHAEDDGLIHDGACYYKKDEVSDWRTSVKELLRILCRNANRCLPE